MKYEEVRMLSKVSNRPTQYVKLDQLPTNFRAYPENTHIYTRRLNMQESFDLSQVQDTGSNEEIIENVARCYEDVIISDNSDFTLYDLELVDFNLAVAVSTIWSTRRSGWEFTKQCPNAFCKHKIVAKVTLDDFNFTDYVAKVPVPIRIDDHEFNVYPLRVKDLIQSGRICRNDPTITKGILQFAFMLRPVVADDFKDVMDIYNFLRYVPDEDYKALVQIDKEITIVNYPFEKECPSCHNIVKFNKQLVDLKAYL